MNQNDLMLVESIASSIDGKSRYVHSPSEDTFDYVICVEDATMKEQNVVRIPKHLFEGASVDMHAVRNIISSSIKGNK
ncbi:MAG TPA: hypothetical protein VFM18_24225 [Methanosarcina sp.]|nr:hypothetical protein [Methanosarcina sp.]